MCNNDSLYSLNSKEWTYSNGSRGIPLPNQNIIENQVRMCDLSYERYLQLESKGDTKNI